MSVGTGGNLSGLKKLPSKSLSVFADSFMVQMYQEKEKMSIFDRPIRSGI
jgi:hypothetical protein